MGQRLNRLWRGAMTACCFALFGLGGMLLSLLWFNLLLLFQRDAQQRQCRARRSIAASFRCFLRCARATGVLDYRIEGAEKLESDRGCLVVANHPTLIDYVLLASVMPEVDCLVKAELQRNLFFSGVIKAADYLINSQSDTLLAESRRRLMKGDVIMIFPEGTRTRPGEPLKLQRGAANIALRCDCDLRLVHIVCSQPTLAKQHRWYQIPAQKPVFSVVVGERLSVNDFKNDNPHAPSLAARRLTRYLESALTPQHY
ncbi:1-acyl-sn-glycerol-3-phosphate acyltransferase [Izhakiella australiensis]|uniref:1-acyl-sn-glycerol-3-phosphate acyltransferase n=1 Tax=Izhakiella australiensis TaxID=1926881 RepID=A0A1S8YPH8_9GAMM|nr:lysophospholipid acyltransferase family protein [Izhakiella australiensis]OON40970.1 1-acyl-sn-glycerol-3-phosphate acyltransferase [Izhakiella australiensis]